MIPKQPSVLILLYVCLCGDEGVLCQLHLGGPAEGNAQADPKSAVLSALLQKFPAVSGNPSDNRIKEVNIEVEDGKGMDDKGVFQPAGYEIKEKFIYLQTQQKNAQNTSGPSYPQGLGNVIFAGCFGNNYAPGDKCYDFKKANPFLCLDLLDGAMFMGVGFDVTQTYTSESRRKGLLQRKCKEKRYFHSKEVPDNLVAQGIYEYNVHTTSYSSSRAYQKELASKAGVALMSSTFSKEMQSVNAGVSGGAFGISVGVSTSFSSGSEQSQSESNSNSQESSQQNKQQKDLYIAVLEADLLMFEMFQDSVKPDDLRWEFVNEFLSLPPNYYSVGAVEKFQDFILRWGTHYVKYAKFGGQMKMIKTKESTKDESFSMFQQRAEHEFQRSMSTMSSAQVQAKVSSPWVSVEAGYGRSNEQGSSSGSATSSEERDLSRSYQEDAYGSTTFEIEGGDPAIASAIFDAFSPSFKTDFKGWVESIPEFSKPFGFQLGDISELLNFNVQALLGEPCSVCFSPDRRAQESQCSIIAGNTSIDYNCTEIKQKERVMIQQRLALQRAVEVYMKEGPIPVYDMHIEGGPVECERDGVASFEQVGFHPTWEEIKHNSTEVRIVFDMRQSIPGVASANDVLQVKLFHDKWFVVRNDRMRLYDGFSVKNEAKKQVNIRGLVMSYDEETGLFDVTLDDYRELSDQLTASDVNHWIEGATIARAQYINPLKVLDARNVGTVGYMSQPCQFKWSNVHRFNPSNEGRCIRFTASSRGNIYVLLAVIPLDMDTWYHIQITPGGVAIYKALKLQQISTEYGSRGQGSAILYQTYFVCVAVEQDQTRVWYGTAQNNEEVGHNVYLEYVDANDNLDVKYYTFGAGEELVDVTDISVLAETFLTFACQGKMVKNPVNDHGRVCTENCHTECDPFFSCTKPNDPSACGKCATLFELRYPDDHLVCVPSCSPGYEQGQRDGTNHCLYMTTCPETFTHVGELKSCYHLNKISRNWTDAEASCSSLNARLLDVSTEMEGSQVRQLITKDLGTDELPSSLTFVSAPVSLAQSSEGVTCSASSNYSSQYSCEAALFDGSEIHGPNHEWVTRMNTAVGAWIEVQFPREYTVTSIRLLQRCHGGYQNKRVEFSYQDMTTQSALLTCFNGFDISDCTGQYWQTFWVPAKKTNSVKITLNSTCAARYSGFRRYNGFREVKIYGYKGATNSPPTSDQQVNLAMPVFGTTCSASSSYSEQFTCDKALDGSELAGDNNEWVIASGVSAVGSWIEVDFHEVSTVTAVELLQRCYRGYQNKGIRLTFEDGTTTDGELRCFSGADRFQCNGQYWQRIEVNKKTTSTVRMQITSVCTAAADNGFREIRVLGYTGTQSAHTYNYWTSGKWVGTNWMWMSHNRTIESGTLSSMDTSQGHCLAVGLSGSTQEECSKQLPFICKKPDFG